MEIFARRNFTCDCGTIRFPATSPCTLRIDPATGMKGPVHSQEAATGNTYNQNFRNRFCGCGEWYDPHKQKGTMFQCLGLATEQEGGCGEDWWHPECLLGLPQDWHKAEDAKRLAAENASGETLQDIQKEDEDEHPVPPGFPDEDDFETLICYKCVGAVPWIRKYAGSKGFMSLTYDKKEPPLPTQTIKEDGKQAPVNLINTTTSAQEAPSEGTSRKRKAEDIDVSGDRSVSLKKTKTDPEAENLDAPLHSLLPPPPTGTFSILALNDDFRSQFCRCRECYPDLSKHPQLMEEEELYEPPISEDGDAQGGSVGTGSLLERGEAALSNVDRVRAIGKRSRSSLRASLTVSTEGVMAYNHMKDKLKSFLQPFAESGQAVGAEDIKSYFEKLRGDNEAIKEARAVASANGDGPDGDSRQEQSGA